MKKTLSLFIAALLAAQAYGQEQNYVQTTIYKQASATRLDNPTQEQAAVQATYLDGLGRPIQQRAYRQSGTGTDLVTHFAYDAFGRQAREYLPYPTQSASLAYDSGAATGVTGFYGTPPAGMEATANPFSEKLFENSHLNRVLKQAAPGNSWAMGSGHEVRMAYDTNSDIDGVRKYSAQSQWQEAQRLYTTTLTLIIGTQGNYPAGQLYKTVTKDENWTSGNLNTTEEFRDKEGRTLLKRNYTTTVVESTTRTVSVDTYYVYDQFGNLSFVLPPDAARLSQVHQTVIDNKCYQYRYDKRNRLVEKRLPGKQWEFLVYDRLDRVVATGPAYAPFTDLASSIGWLVTKYDAFNRVCYTAWMPSTTVTAAGRKALQDEKDGTGKTLSESRISGLPDMTVNGVTFRYTSSVLPIDGYYVLTVNYYDDYGFPNGPAAPDFSDIEQQAIFYNLTEKPKGLPTGSWVRVLEASTSFNAQKGYVLYDKKGRAVKERTQNHMGGYTQKDSKLDFLGRAKYTVTSHKRMDSDTPVQIREDFAYSDQDRLLTHTHTINGNPPELLTKNEYDELGRLALKNVGGVQNAPLQKVNFGYNVRGWLEGINTIGGQRPGDPEDLFAFAIRYQNPVNETNYAGTPLFNGNISETVWNSASDNIVRKYGYSYDPMNRLTNAVYIKDGARTDSYNESIEYDLVGNITYLKRNGGNDGGIGTAVQIDELLYDYFHNRLNYVEDFTTDPQGFKDGSMDYSEFAYDANGNMVKDLNKGITGITYNHLNLPVKIFFGSESSKIEYLYAADGKKVGKKVTSTVLGDSKTVDYLDGFQYEFGELEFFPTAEGYVRATPKKLGYSYSYVYNYTDHLGNVRLSYAKDPQNPNVLRILEENHYYPFGLKHTNYNSDQLVHANQKQTVILTDPIGMPLEPNPIDVPLPYQYKYNGKEFQDELGLNFYDYGARNYDPAIGRWMNIDPLAETSRRFSPYTYALNNPVYFIDPDGMRAVAGDEWLNTEGQQVYDPSANGGKGSYTKHATEQDKKFGDALRNSGEEGQKQFDALTKSEAKITVDFKEGKSSIPGQLGFTNITDYETKNDGSVVVEKATIDIFMGTINEIHEKIMGSDNPTELFSISDKQKESVTLIKNKNLSPFEMAVGTFGHEIGHTNNKNAELQQKESKGKNFGRFGSEFLPEIITNRILNDLAKKK